MRWRLKPYVMEASALSMWWRVQPYVMEAAALCDGGCNPMCWRLQPYLVEAATLLEEGQLREAGLGLALTRSLHHPEQVFEAVVAWHAAQAPPPEEAHV